jgi:predicted RNA methylase
MARILTSAARMTDNPSCPPAPDSRDGGELLYLYDRALRLTPAQIAEALRAGRCPLDRAFDQFLPDELEVVSSQYWTPLAVTLRATRWLDELGIRTVVDLGSGCGKFCVAAALAGQRSFVGLEQRPGLVDAARRLAEVFEVQDRVRFEQGVVGHAEIPRADAYYLFNPFGENIFGSDSHIAEDVELSEERYNRDVAFVEELLRDAPAGTYVLTYNGFGGRVPPEYREVRVDRDLPSVLRMWRKTSRPAAPAW